MKIFVGDVIKQPLEDPEEIWARSRLKLAKIHTAHKALATPAIGHKKRLYTSTLARANSRKSAALKVSTVNNSKQNRKTSRTTNSLTGGGEAYTVSKARRSNGLQNNQSGDNARSYCCYTSFSAPTSEFRSSSGNLLKFSKNGYKTSSSSNHKTFTNKKSFSKNKESGFQSKSNTSNSIKSNTSNSIKSNTSNSIISNTSNLIKQTTSKAEITQIQRKGISFSKTQSTELKNEINKLVPVNKDFGDNLQQFKKEMYVINDAIKTWEKEKQLLVAEQKDSKKDYMEVVSEPKTTKFKREEKMFEVESEEKGFLSVASDAIWIAGNIGVWVTLAHLNNFM